jgi:hypothetical protein
MGFKTNWRQRSDEEAREMLSVTKARAEQWAFERIADGFDDVWIEDELAACRTESFHNLGIVENGRFRLPWRFDLAALAPVDPAIGLYL